ncbi:MAG: threonine--tRNA ligase [Candidatus Moranbacteria bacterium]|nr:threonine--tRNA ligase [Candidatus Moranbacteria bacterium]NTW45966.1 threonine--tRNA ligase [Candidatus Moranbacteria bacterium]
MKHLEIATVRHSLAHILAMAILKRDPNAKLGTGPATDDGFFYDVLLSDGITFSPEDFDGIVAGMRAIIRENAPFERSVVTADEARHLFADNPFKLEIVSEAEARGEEITVYRTGNFVDLCAGPHAGTTGDIDPESFAMKGLAGAYWRGDEKNPMLVRISGYAFLSKTELDTHLAMLEEAKKRDHRKLGKELGLFTVSPLVGAGLPLMQPKGMIIRQEIESLLWRLHRDRGYSRVWTPHIAKEALYETSGHASKFGDELFRVSGKEEKFIMKPMNCPHHMQIFADNRFSYRDMPVRYFEPATVYRDEKSGQLGGLTRVRAITQDDGHLFCRVSQIAEEVSTIVGIIRTFYTVFGMMDGYWVSLSVRDGEKEKYLGTDEAWEAAETALERAAMENGLNYRRVEGEAAFYGPKLDFMFKDAIGREWQLATIQCDFNLPERFDLSFTNEQGEAERPVVIHRAISGSLERFMGIMIEHYAGAFPFWLAPEQVRILPIGESEAASAKNVLSELRAVGIRAELDLSDESLGKKIRSGKVAKVPYLAVIGKREAENGSVTLESRDHGKVGELTITDLVARLAKETDPLT